MTWCEIRVDGQLAASVEELIRSRFGDVALRPGRTGTTVVVSGLDPAAERALLNLLWDTGHDVVLLRATR